MDPVPLTDDLILCTRNRPDDLRRCLASVAAQRRPPSRVLVVDGSDGGETRSLVERINREAWLREPVTLLRTGPGIGAARNLGLRHATRDVVHFVDDDVVLEPGYFEAIMGVFEDPGRDGVAGVGGVITDLSYPPPTTIERWLMLAGDEGTVLPSGRIGLIRRPERPIDVEWLPGCSMSFARSLLPPDPFDARLARTIEAEDVEMTYRLSRSGRLVVVPEARLEHHESPIDRHDGLTRTRLELPARYVRVRRRVGRLRPAAFWWSAFGQLGYFAALGVVRRSRFLLRMAGATALGILDALRLRFVGPPR